jgi:ribosomal protein S18 acetylase RimI-like enzyme
MASVHVRQASAEDIAQLVNLQFEVYPPPSFEAVARWDASQLEAHQRVFPEGQLVATLDERVVGAATTMITTSERAGAPHRFRHVTGDNFLKGHTPDGDALYGVDLLVSPYFRGQGVARALYEARFALQERRGLQHFYAGARISGYGAVKDELTPDEYLRQVVDGEREDPTLSVQLHMGFEPVCLLPRYLPDPETANWAVLIHRPLPGPAASD